MSKYDYSDDMLNMFIDEQLDNSEMHEIHAAVLADNETRERVCQLKAIRELVGFAYQKTPRSRYDRRIHDSNMNTWRNVAAALLLCLGVTIGWAANEFGIGNVDKAQLTTANNVFHYFSELNLAGGDERKIVLHITTGDVRAVKTALDEMDILLASYESNDMPMQIDVIANRDGINVLRSDVSPYVDRIEQMMMSNSNIKFFACERTINKLAKAEHKTTDSIKFIGRTSVHESAQDLIPERLQKGWVYIKV